MQCLGKNLATAQNRSCASRSKTVAGCRTAGRIAAGRLAYDSGLWGHQGRPRPSTIAAMTVTVRIERKTLTMITPLLLQNFVIPDWKGVNWTRRQRAFCPRRGNRTVAPDRAGVCDGDHAFAPAGAEAMATQAKTAPRLRDSPLPHHRVN